MVRQRDEQVQVMIAGVGGRGVLVAGKILAEAAMSEYPYVLDFSNYAGAIRGGDCECTVILSDVAISSPVVLRPPAVLILASSALKIFESRVAPGGTIIIDSTLVPERVGRRDVQVLYVPATAIALSLGSSKTANLVLLGAYLAFSKALPLDLVEEALEHRLSGPKAAALLSSNKKAIHEGAKFMANYLTGAPA